MVGWFSEMKMRMRNGFLGLKEESSKNVFLNKRRQVRHKGRLKKSDYHHWVRKKICILSV